MSLSSTLNNYESFNSEPDDGDVSGLKSMSPLRLSMFILSILVSILACCVFMWVIPCDLATCSAAPSHDIRYLQLTQLENMMEIINCISY